MIKASWSCYSFNVLFPRLGECNNNGPSSSALTSVSKALLKTVSDEYNKETSGCNTHSCYSDRMCVHRDYILDENRFTPLMVHSVWTTWIDIIKCLQQLIDAELFEIYANVDPSTIVTNQTSLPQSFGPKQIHKVQVYDASGRFLRHLHLTSIENFQELLEPRRALDRFYIVLLSPFFSSSFARSLTRTNNFTSTFNQVIQPPRIHLQSFAFDSICSRPPTLESYSLPALRLLGSCSQPCRALSSWKGFIFNLPNVGLCACDGVLQIQPKPTKAINLVSCTSEEPATIYVGCFRSLSSCFNKSGTFRVLKHDLKPPANEQLSGLADQPQVLKHLESHANNQNLFTCSCSQRTRFKTSRLADSLQRREGQSQINANDLDCEAEMSNGLFLPEEEESFKALTDSYCFSASSSMMGRHLYLFLDGEYLKRWVVPLCESSARVVQRAEEDQRKKKKPSKKDQLNFNDWIDLDDLENECDQENNYSPNSSISSLIYSFIAPVLPNHVTADVTRRLRMERSRPPLMTNSNFPFVSWRSRLNSLMSMLNFGLWNSSSKSWWFLASLCNDPKTKIDGYKRFDNQTVYHTDPEWGIELKILKSDKGGRECIYSSDHRLEAEQSSHPPQ